MLTVEETEKRHRGWDIQALKLREYKGPVFAPKNPSPAVLTVAAIIAAETEDDFVDIWDELHRLAEDEED